MVNTHPLIIRDPDSPIAYLTKPITNFGLVAGKVNVSTFVSHVYAVAEALSEGKYAINLCENRYVFLVSFCAVILRGQTNLLPPNKNIAMQTQLVDKYQDSYIIHDGCGVATSITNTDLSKLQLIKDPLTIYPAIPQIADKHLACISFTSGSTGQSRPNLKYWRTLHRSTAINGQYMMPVTDEAIFQLATVPAQHMWGLETSILIPLFHNVCMSNAHPLFPQDIQDILEELPKPRMLVSTPVHIRALAASCTDTLQLSVVLCATSPLTVQLAQEIESKFACELKEVYGCSEVGSMAVRITAKEEQWLRFEGIQFKADGKNTIASADHLPEPVVLQDYISSIDHQHFILSGRTSDLVKIAGKRGSLFEINQILLRYEGLQDGVIIHPESSKATTTRLCAVVALKEGIDKAMLSGYLREHLDSAFIPRPIYVVDSLPREANGKLLRTSINALLASLRS